MTLYECWTCRHTIVNLDNNEYVVITGIDKKNKLVKVLPEGKKIPKLVKPERLNQNLIEY